MSDSMEWQVPQWLTDSYLEEVLRKYLQDKSIQIQNVDVKPATAKGENYASVMTRLKISFSTATEKKPQELSFIMKCSYENDPFVANIMNGYDIYNTEMRMYEKVLPQLAGILREAGDNEQIFANTLKVDYERSTIIFEDLAVKQYVLADRLQGLNKEHARVDMKKLAKFHAAAAVLNKRLHGSLEKFQRGIFSPHTRGLACMFEYFTEVCANFAKNHPSLGLYYHDKLMKLQPYLVEYATKAYSDNPTNHFFTLCHGDLWINNMLMRYRTTNTAEQQLEDLLFVDFQFSNWSSPAVDLYYFFNTSLEPRLQMDTDAQAELVQYYYTVLVETLNRLHYTDYIPTLHEFRVDLEERKLLGEFAIRTAHNMWIL